MSGNRKNWTLVAHEGPAGENLTRRRGEVVCLLGEEGQAGN